MDADRFDTLARLLASARSRRGALATLVAGPLGRIAAPDAAAKKRGKGKPKKRKRKPSRPAVPTASPPPPASPCPNPATPNWCPSTRTCLPACTGTPVFSAATCSCACAEQTCCSCQGGSNPFCSAGYTVRDRCRVDCLTMNPNADASDFVSEPRTTAVCTDGAGCRRACFGACGEVDVCQGDLTGCGVANDGGCFRVLGGTTATWCGGRTVTAADCGCTSHEQCVARHGPGAFCALDTGANCGGCPSGAFCVAPR